MAEFMPRPNRLSCPTRVKFFDVPGVPPPGPTVTLAGLAVVPPAGAAAPNAPTAAPAMATQVAKETAAFRYFMIATSLCRTGRLHAKPPRPGRKAGRSWQTSRANGADAPVATPLGIRSPREADIRLDATYLALGHSDVWATTYRPGSTAEI